MGVKLLAVRRAISFRQEAWIEPYISENTVLRQQAVDEFEKDYFKLLNNAFFGKTMENVRNRIRIELVNSERRHWWHTSKPSFKRFEIFDDDLVGAELAVTCVSLDRPMYVGFSVLELSKLLMYKFHYDVIRVNFPESKLCFTDTDSFLYHITCKNLYSEHLYRLREHFDFSNYPDNHILYPPGISEEEKHHIKYCNKAVVGRFKDEAGGVPLKEFVGLRSKMYSILLDGGKQKHTAAGVKKCVRDQELTHSLYREVLLGTLREGPSPENALTVGLSTEDSSVEGQGPMPENPVVEGPTTVGRPLADHMISQVTFRSHNHTVYTVRQRKCGLTRYDDKRWILQNGVDTRPHGHYLNSRDEN